MIDVDAVTNSTMYQGIVSSAEDNDSTYFERTDLDSHDNVVLLGKNCCVVDHSGRKTEVHPFSPEHEALKVLIVDIFHKIR